MIEIKEKSVTGQTIRLHDADIRNSGGVYRPATFCWSLLASTITDEGRQTAEQL